MLMKNKNYRKLQLISALIAIVVFAVSAAAQTTAFSYQGKLNNGGTAANGSYEMQFKLFDALSGGAQVGATVIKPSVTVINGIFTTTLDFDAAPFDGGAARYLEIGVRPAGNPNPLTILGPRVQIVSAPFAIQAKNASTADNSTNSLQLGGIDASAYVTTTSVGNAFIKNDTVPQTGNFNISGNGTVGGTLQANQIRAQTGTGFYGLTHTDGTTTIGTFVGTNTFGVIGGWLGTPSNSPLYFFSNNSQPQATILPNGNFGIGTTVPAAKLDVNGNTVIRTTGSGGNMQLGNPGGETGLTIGTTNRADIRFDNTTLRLFVGNGTSIPTNGLIVNTSGNVATSGNLGVGTFAPDTRLTLNGGPTWTSNGWTASMNLRNGSAIGWDANASGLRWGIGQTTGGLYFFRSFSSFGTNASPADYAMTITDTGNITQPRDKNGLIKAMIFVNADGTIIRCYNGMTNTSAGNCGFSISRVISGDYDINFGFQVNDRFVSVTPQRASAVNIGTGFIFTGNPNLINVQTFITDVDRKYSRADNPFMIIVY